MFMIPRLEQSGRGPLGGLPFGSAISPSLSYVQKPLALKLYRAPFVTEATATPLLAFASTFVASLWGQTYRSR